jgi:hypothetical protein
LQRHSAIFVLYWCWLVLCLELQVSSNLTPRVAGTAGAGALGRSWNLRILGKTPRSGKEVMPIEWFSPRQVGLLQGGRHRFLRHSMLVFEARGPCPRRRRA